jgi:hypothetical protein
MFVYFGNGHARSRGDDFAARWLPECRPRPRFRHRRPGFSSPTRPGPVATRACPAGSPGADRAVPRRRAPAGWHRPDRAIGRAGPVSRLRRPSGAGLRLSSAEPGARVDEPAAPGPRRSVVGGSLVRGGRLAGARPCGGGRAGGRSEPSRPHPPPGLGRSLAKRRDDAARGRRPRLPRPGRPRATGRCPAAFSTCARAPLDSGGAGRGQPCRSRERTWPWRSGTSGTSRGTVARSLRHALCREAVELVGAGARPWAARHPPARGGSRRSGRSQPAEKQSATASCVGTWLRFAPSSSGALTGPLSPPGSRTGRLQLSPPIGWSPLPPPPGRRGCVSGSAVGRPRPVARNLS